MEYQEKAGTKLSELHEYLKVMRPQKPKKHVVYFQLFQLELLAFLFSDHDVEWHDAKLEIRILETLGPSFFLIIYLMTYPFSPPLNPQSPTLLKFLKELSLPYP